MARRGWIKDKKDRWGGGGKEGPVEKRVGGLRKKKRTRLRYLEFGGIYAQNSSIEPTLLVSPSCERLFSFYLNRTWPDCNEHLRHGRLERLRGSCHCIDTADFSISIFN